MCTSIKIKEKAFNCFFCDNFIKIETFRLTSISAKLSLVYPDTLES